MSAGSLKQLGVGVIGTNSWAESAHLPGYAADERVRLVALCDLVPERARAMQTRFGVCRLPRAAC